MKERPGFFWGWGGECGGGDKVTNESKWRLIYHKDYSPFSNQHGLTSKKSRTLPFIESPDYHNPGKFY